MREPDGRPTPAAGSARRPRRRGPSDTCPQRIRHRSSTRSGSSSAALAEQPDPRVDRRRRGTSDGARHPRAPRRPGPTTTGPPGGRNRSSRRGAEQPPGRPGRAGRCRPSTPRRPGRRAGRRSRFAAGDQLQVGPGPLEPAQQPAQVPVRDAGGHLLEQLAGRVRAAVAQLVGRVGEAGEPQGAAVRDRCHRQADGAGLRPRRASRSTRGDRAAPAAGSTEPAELRSAAARPRARPSARRSTARRAPAPR